MEFMQYTFMQRALAAGVLISFLTGMVSFFITSKNLAFLGEGISHISFGGLALAVLLGIHPLLGALVFALFAGFSIARISLNSRISEDTSIGILVSFSMALGIILLSYKKGYTSDLLSFLFGSILTITPADMLFILGSAVLAGSVFYRYFNQFLMLVFDREYGRIMRLPVDRYYYLLIFLIICTILSLIKITGVVLLTGLLVLPGATSYLLARNYREQVLFSILTAFINIMLGLVLSYYLNWPSGATIVILSTIVFSVIIMIKGAGKRGK
ncbi:MAG: metal ABC transporter permease [bacterium]|nr:metal ABC transporter permease [bacterium]